MKRMLKVLVAVAALASAAEGQAAEPVRLRLGLGTPTIQALILNIAIGEHLGYYREEGISLTVHPMGNNAATLQALASGTNQVSTVVPSFLLPLAARGQAPPIRAFYNYTPKFKYDIVVNPDSPLRTLADLKGKAIGVPAFGHTAYPIIKALVKAQGWDLDKEIRLVAVGLGPTAGSALRERRVDAYFAGDTDFAQMETQGFALRHLGVKPPAHLDGTGGFYVGAMADWIRQNPRLAVGVGRAVAKGTLFAQTNLEGASWVFMKMYPESVPKGVSREEGVKMVATILRARSVNWLRDGQKHWGVMLRGDWENEVKFLDLEAKIPDATQYYTNEFIEEINKFDAQKVVDQAKAFKMAD